MPKLSDSQILNKLTTAPGWSRLGDMLVRTWQFGTTERSLDFVNRVADLAQQADHYPEIHLRFRTVRIDVSTHADGGLTERDFQLAAAIDQLPVDRKPDFSDQLS